MDSKVVAREIKQEIWPLLRREGFTEFSPKTAWRHTSDQIHAIPFQFPVRKGPDPSVKPQEYHCHFRYRLQKAICQPILPRRDTWYVEPDGSNLLQCLDDSRTVILQVGLPWFSRFESLESVLSALMDQEELPEVYATRNSPARKHMIGYVARRLDRTDIADLLIAEAESELKEITERVYSIGRRRKPK